MKWPDPAEKPSWVSFAEEEAVEFLDDCFGDETDGELPELLTREQAARFLGVSTRWLSDLSGDGPRGGRIPKVVKKRKPFYRLEDLQRYKESVQHRKS